VQVLVAGPSADLGHDLEPEVVAESAEGLDQGLEGDLDLEAQAVGEQNRLGAQSSVGGDEDALGVVGVDAEHKADQEAVPEKNRGRDSARP